MFYSPIPPYSQSVVTPASGCDIWQVSVLLSQTQLQPLSRACQSRGGHLPKISAGSSGEDESAVSSPGLGPGCGHSTEVRGTPVIRVTNELFLVARCLSLDVSCVEAYRVLILELLARNGDSQEAATLLGDLAAQLDQFEPNTHWLYHEAALSPARLVRHTHTYTHTIILFLTGWW